MNSRSLRFILFTGLLAGAFPFFLNAQPCECTNCPVPIFDNGTFEGYLDVTVNGPNNLAVCPLQQVCFEITHTWVGDLCVTLTSPGGLNYMVMADVNNNFGGCGNSNDNINVCIDVGTGNPLTNNTEYVCNGPPGTCLVGNWTMPCGGVVDPVTGALQAPGCNLNAFNQPGQPANGTWTLTVNDICSQDIGFLQNWSLTFACGVQDCFSCVANAGTLNQPNVMGCIGSPALNLNVVPQYPPPATQPPPSDYGYVWVITNTVTGIITNFVTGGPNLNNLPPGNYTICGLSYYLEDGTQYLMFLGQPYNNLANALSSGTPPFCGDLSSNCFTAKTGPPIPPVTQFASICYGDCFTTPIGTQCCVPGVCSYNIPSWLGCDSITNVIITVLPPEVTPITQTVCPGACVTIAGVQYCQPGGYTIPFTGSDGCDSTVVLTLYNVPVLAVIGPPPVITCANPVVTLNGSGSVGVSYQWTNANGQVLGNGPTLQVNQAACYNLTVTNTLNGVTCSDVETVCVTSNLIPPGLPVIQGPSSICINQNATYTISSDPNATSYDWTLPPGATLVSGGDGSTSVTVNWTGPAGGNICVVAVNGCGPGPVACLPVTLNNLPGIPVITGVGTVCPGDVESYTATASSNTTGYTWTVPPGATITGGQGTNSITVDWGNSAGGNVCMTPSNSCGNGPAGCLPVVIGQLPSAPVVSGPSPVCAGDTVVYSTPVDPEANAFTWSVPSCATILSGQGTNAISVLWSNTCSSGQVCVEAANGCGATGQVCFDVTVNDIPDISVVNGSPTPCENSTLNYFADPVTGATSYIWTVSGGTIQSGQGTPSIDVSWTTGTGSVCLIVENDCGQSPEFCLPVDVGALPQPPAVSGPDVVCDGSVTQYSTPVDPAAIGYSWTTACGTITTGQNTPMITVDWTGCPTGGDVCVTVQTDCGTSPVSCFTVTSGTIPVSPVLTGPTDPCLNSTGVYCAQPDPNASAYNWTVSGGLILSGQGTDCATVEWTSLGNASICATASNGCGLSPQTCYDIVVDGPPAPPVVDGEAQPCINGIATYTITSADPDVTGFNWTTTNGGIILSGQGTNTIQVEWPQAGVAQVCATAGNICGFGPADCFGLEVINYPTPDAGADDGICGLDYTLAASLSTGTGVWTASGPGTALFSNVSDPHATVSVSDFGTYTFTWTETDVNCASQDQVEIAFNDPPVLAGAILEPCTPDGQNYTVSFTLTGGQMPYTITGTTGGLMNGSDFTSDLIPSGTPYSFSVTDFMGCGPLVITGQETCNCVTEAGDLDLTPLSACEDLTVQVATPPNAVLDPNDTFEFLLHSDNGTNGNTVGTIIAQNMTGIFGFLPGTMNYNTTYYISFLVGNDTGSGVDLGDDCTDLAQGVPVMFYPLPVAAFANDATVCEGQTANLGLTVTGSTCVDIDYILSDGTTGTLTCVQTGDQLSVPTGTTSLTATLLQVTDQNACTQALNDVGNITVNITPQATVTPAATICNSTDSGFPTVLNFSSLVTGGDLGGTWVNTGGAIVTGAFPSLNFDGTAPGVYDFTYTTDSALPPCLDQSYVVQVTVEDCQCPVLDFLPAAPLCNDGGTLNLNTLQVQSNAGVYAVVSGPIGAVNFPQLNGSVLDAAGADPGAYTLSFTLSATPPQGCAVSNSFTINISDALTAGNPAAPAELCTGEVQSISLGALLSGADAGGVWTEVSTVPSTGGAFNAGAGTFNTSGQAAFTYRFRYTVTPAAPCTADFAEVEVIIHPLPVADAGANAVLTCEQPELQLGGDATTTGPGIVYQWTAASGPFPGDPGALHPTVNAAGVYTLTVTNTITGCIATDGVELTSSQEPPFPSISITPISCYGEDDGIILIDSVSGGVPPYLISINGGPFNSTTQFTELPPATYTLVVEDANGCQTEPAIIIDIQQPQEIDVTLVAYLDGDNIIRLGEAVDLEALSNIPGSDIDTIIWSPAGMVSCDTCIQVTAMPLTTTTFSVTIESNGCADSDALQIVVRRDQGIFAPNIFTPNGDGENDIFMLFAGPEVARIRSFLIFDRWGETVHQQFNVAPNDPILGWNGMYRGRALDPAVLTWFAEVEFIDGRVEIFKGDVSLVK